MLHSWRLTIQAYLVSVGVLSTAATAQCVSGWTIGDGFAGVDGPVQAMTRWDPDGSGPQSERIVVGGSFYRAGSAFCRVASWDGAAWSPLGSSDLGEVRALAVLPNNQIVASFTYVPSIGRAVAVWDGSQWMTLGNPSGTTDGLINALLPLPDGTFIAAGSFRIIAGVPANRIARWSGTEWLPLGSGVSADADWNISVNALATLPNGDIVAAGNFVTNTPGNVPAKHIARWNGQTWLPVGNRQGELITSMAATPDGQIFAGGAFYSQAIGGYVYMSRWDGSQWAALPGPPHVFGYPALAVDTDAGSSLLAAWGGSVRRWTGTSWTIVAQGIEVDSSALQTVNTLLPLPHSDFAVGGTIQKINGLPAKFLGRWTSSAPVIVRSPTQQQLCVGSTLRLDVEANSAQPLQFQWRRGTEVLADGPQPGGASINGATTSAITISGVSLADAGDYKCVVTDACDSIQSAAAVVAIYNCCPSDLNHDGIVNDDDFVIFLQAYNQVLCP